MFIAKKKKIREYLTQKSDNEKSTFDFLLSDYLDGSLKEMLTSTGIKKTEIHIDWLDDIKCIGVQGRYEKYYLDLQINPDEFYISFDLIEPDDGTVYPLESKKQVYDVLANTVKTLK